MSKTDMINAIFNITEDWIQLQYLTNLSYEEVEFEYKIIAENNS